MAVFLVGHDTNSCAVAGGRHEAVCNYLDTEDEAVEQEVFVAYVAFVVADKVGRDCMV